MKWHTPLPCSLIEAVCQQFPQSSKTTIRSWLHEGRITVDGAVVKIGSSPLQPHQKVSFEPVKRTKKAGDVTILYQDSHLVVIDKPQGLLSVATKFETKKTAYSHLKSHFYPQKVSVIHRLDQETSGVMVFALSTKAYEKLKLTFAAHDLDRQYIAIVEGQMPLSSGTWDCYLYEDAQYKVHATLDTEYGERAITHYQVMQSTPRYSLLQLRLETGKKNQIRVHCEEAGHPVVGDMKYGATSNPVKRLCLHSHLLAFVHPVTRKPVSFTSPLPPAFNKILPMTDA